MIFIERLDVMNIYMIWNDLPVCGLITNQVMKVYSSFNLYTNRIVIPNELVRDYFEREPIVIDFDSIETFIKHSNTQSVIFVPGWSFRTINTFIDKNRFNNVKIVLMSDNDFQLNLRKLVGSLYFRFFMRPKYHAVFVPGHSGARLMRLFGFSKDKIYKGMYGFSNEIFKNENSIINRDNTFLFVGQLIERKSIEKIIKSHRLFKQTGGTWSLRIIGDGPLKNIVENYDCEYFGFQDPIGVSRIMNKSKCLLMLSRVEHWGTVVVEAMACGLPILIYDKVGSHQDLFCENGVTINALSIDKIVEAMFQIENLNNDEITHMSFKSIAKSKSYNSLSYLEVFNKIIKDLEN